MTSGRKTKPPKPDETPAGENTIWLHHDPAIAQLEVVSWLAYPRVDRAAKAYNRLVWWYASDRGQAVPEKPSRLEERLAAIDKRLRERLLAGSLYAAKARRYHQTQPPWNSVTWPPELAGIVAALDAAMDAAQPPGTLELLRRANGAKAAGDRTWFRKLTAESRLVVHLAASWVEHASMRPSAPLEHLAFHNRSPGDVEAIIRNAETLRSRIGADPSNNIATEAMLCFAQRPAPLAD
jgi:hypothetical protein